ncbi:peptidylprolyl isomerase [Modestobacter excelsi]|uniref:peptidylprolyl isomerase n=1 Tax=Modestobacter excelsi TaxID=2213161 RepID=UPI00110CA536|nr:peptidylprolyl isomerase [Modestobacter excelsi]
MPTNKQRREQAQRRLQRQLERREQLARKRRRNLLIGVTVLAVLAVVGAFFIITGLADDGSDTTAAPSSSAPSSATAAPAGQTTVAGPCTYTTDGTPSAGVAVTPPSGDIATTGTLALTMATNVGDIGLTLDRAAAPCAAASFEALSKQGYFDNTPCHRETSSESLKVLQCGDPSGQGTGGPGYTFPTQVTGSETYPRGTVAMANSSQGTDGSQFFLVYGDSQLQPDYTVVGRIDDTGLAVLDEIAATGIANSASDGAPAQPVTITAMTPAA